MTREFTWFNRGERLRADDLNDNFQILFQAVAAVANQAPGAQAQPAAHEISRVRRELDRIEQHLSGSERQRNLQQYAPLAVVAELLRRVERLENELHAMPRHTPHNRHSRRRPHRDTHDDA